MPIGNQVTLTSNVASKVISVTATSGQTVFNVQGGYRINQISVFRNGVKLTESDYTARDGASVTLLSPATLADVLEFQVFDDFRVADAIVSAASNQTIFGNLTVTGTLTGATIGIQSGGTVVGTAKTLNFVGTGNTFAVNGDIIDVSIAQGGCFETSKITNHNDPTFVKHDVIHYCVPNIASRVSRTASFALSNIFSPILLEMGNTGGPKDMIVTDYGFRAGVYIYQGVLTSEVLGKVFDLQFKDIELILLGSKF